MRSVLAGLRTLILPWGSSSATPRIVIGPDVPATLRAASVDFTWTAAVVKWFNSTDYSFEAIGTYNVPVIHVPITATGTYSPATGVLFNSFEQTNPSGTILFSSAAYNSLKLSFSWRYSNTTFFSDASVVFDGATSAGAIDQQTGFTTETWHPLTYANGWANNGGSNVTGQYRLVAAPARCVQLVGAFTPGTKANGTALTTALPAAYRPTHAADVPVNVDVTAAVGGQSPHFNISTGGVLSCYGVTAATFVSVNALYPLDA